MVFASKAHFTRKDVLNFRNMYIWSRVNLHRAVQYRHRQQFWNVWTVTIGESFVGLYVVPRRFHGAAFRHFWEHTLPGLSDTALLGIRRNMAQAWWCSSLFQWHRQKLSWDCWYWAMDRKAPSFARPESFWGHLENVMYASAVATAEELLEGFRNGCTSARNTTGGSSARPPIHAYRAEICVALQGQHFEHLL
jgi:hypothetical protein